MKKNKQNGEPPSILCYNLTSLSMPTHSILFFSLSLSLSLSLSAYSPSPLIIPQIWVTIPPILSPLSPIFYLSHLLFSGWLTSSISLNMCPVLCLYLSLHCTPVIPQTRPLYHSNFCSSHSHLLLIGTTSHSPCSCFFMPFHIFFLCPRVPCYVLSLQTIFFKTLITCMSLNRIECCMISGPHGRMLTNIKGLSAL